MSLRIELLPLRQPNPTLTTDDLKVGEIGIGLSHDVYLLTFSGLVELSKPQNTWSYSPERDKCEGGWPTLPLLRILGPGEQILITIL